MASPVVPSARVYPFVASTGDLTYLIVSEAIFVYHHDTETWTRKLANGPHPSVGLSEGGCVMLGHFLYLYYKSSIGGGLYQLNTQTWRWRKLSDGSAGGPGQCRMISYQDQLLLFGGRYDKKPSSKQAGASYEKIKFCLH